MHVHASTWPGVHPSSFAEQATNQNPAVAATRRRAPRIARIRVLYGNFAHRRAEGRRFRATRNDFFSRYERVSRLRERARNTHVTIIAEIAANTPLRAGEDDEDDGVAATLHPPLDEDAAGFVVTGVSTCFVQPFVGRGPESGTAASLIGPGYAVQS